MAEPEPGRISVTAPKDPTKISSKTARSDASEFLALARKRFRTCSEAEGKLRHEQQIDQRFMASEQWPDQVRADREQDGRPCLTINRLPVFKRQVTNQQRQSKPAVQVNPVDSKADPKTAEVFQGIIRHIEIKSSADVAYDTACDHQVTIGRGYFRLIIDWSESDPWKQDIFIRRVRNPFLVYFDPACQEVDYSDARYAFIIEDVPKEEFAFRYGKRVADEASGGGQFVIDGTDRSPDWMPEGKIRVAEYFYVDYTYDNVTLLSDGSELPTSAADSDEMKIFLASQGVSVVRQRKIERKVVKWAKITGSVILEEREWPGRWIPIIPVLGDEVDINGQVDLRGMVRDARDPQRMYNYWVSAETEAIALAPKTPFIGAEGQFEGHEAKWKLANRRNYPYLEYKAKTLGNEMVPPPQRQQMEPPIAAITAATRQADNDLKAVTGLYDASLGERGPAEAARAILARQKQGDMSNSHWVDNLMRAIRFLGKQLVDLIPKVYDVPRVMRITGIDNQPKMVMVHAGNPPPSDEGMMEGIQGIYDLSAGDYDVTISVGPSYQSRRQEAVEAMTAFVSAFPPAAPILGDLMAENMDWPGAAIAAKRLRKMVPAEVLDDDDKPKIPPEFQQKMAQAEEFIQQLQAELEKQQGIIQGQVVQGQSRERVAMIQEQGKMALAAMQKETAAGLEAAKFHMEQMRLMLDRERIGMELQADQQRTMISARGEAGKAAVQAASEDRRAGLQAMTDARTSAIQSSAEQRSAAIKTMSELTKLNEEQAHERQMLEDQQRHEDLLFQREAEHERGLEAMRIEGNMQLETKRTQGRVAAAKAKPKVVSAKKPTKKA